MLRTLAILWSTAPLTAWVVAGGITLGNAHDWAAALGFGIAVAIGLPFAVAPVALALRYARTR
jgi:hypothetical protein